MQQFVLTLFFIPSIFAANEVSAKSNDLNMKIKAIEIGGYEMPIQKGYTIDFEHNVFKIYLEANQPNSQYQFRVIETRIDQEIVSPWQKINGSIIRAADFSPGKYVFEIFAGNGEQKTDKIIVSFKIEQPWWRSFWFWGSCFVAMFLMFYGRERFLQFWAEEEQRHFKERSELELRTLQLQMNPHFVFNALNAIQIFIVTHDSQLANMYLSKFAHLIRLFLDSSRSKYIVLSEEVKLLKLYVEMEKLRFDNMFEFNINIAADVNKHIEIPSMLLQPFVENAINHGLKYSNKKGKLSIDFFYQGQFLVCKIEDSGVGRLKAKEIQEKSRRGYKSQGLKIMEERIKMFNHIGEGDIRVSIADRIKSDDPATEVGTRVEIKFPINA